MLVDVQFRYLSNFSLQLGKMKIEVNSSQFPVVLKSRSDIEYQDKSSSWDTKCLQIIFLIFGQQFHDLYDEMMMENR